MPHQNVLLAGELCDMEGSVGQEEEGVLSCCQLLKGGHTVHPCDADVEEENRVVGHMVHKHRLKLAGGQAGHCDPATYKI